MVYFSALTGSKTGSQILALEEQRAQDAALQAYLEQMSHLLTDAERPLRRAQPSDDLSIVARARTLTVLPRLDGERKARVVQFLYESGLIAAEHRVLDLTEADLRGVDLRQARAANLNGANLSEVNLHRALLTHANLEGANLSGTDLIGADLNGAILIKADLSMADLSETILQAAHLREAEGITNEELDA